jgi:hypothetical protein
LEVNHQGGLRIWAQPLPDAQYIVGADTAGGGASGDFATACVIEAHSRDLVAVYQKRDRPVQWGRKCAKLAQHYNEALLAIETGASAHGLSAVMAATGCGYQNIYRAQRATSASLDMSEHLGWRTDATTKPNLINAAKEALFDRRVIHSRELLEEMRSQTWEAGKDNDKWKMVSREHDDLVMAYAIALQVCKQTYSVNEAPKPMAPAKDHYELVWEEHEAEILQFQPMERHYSYASGF